MDIKKLNLEILIEEYKSADLKIEQYSNKVVNFFNISMLLMAGFFVFVFEKEIISENITGNNYIEFYPYLTFLVYGVIIYQYRRNRIVQGHRKFLAEIINQKLNKNILLFPKITDKFSTRLTSNWYLAFNSIAWIAFVITIYIFSHSFNDTYYNLNGLCQLFLIVIFLLRYIFSDSKIENITYEYCKNRYNENELT